MDLTSYSNLFLFFLAYLLGSIPTSLWAGKFFHRIDIRHYGSKNAGATNTLRVLGVRTGVPVLLFDIFKGWLATRLAFMMPLTENADTVIIQLKLLFGLFAVLGHLFPIFARFKGGKGIATLFGMFLGIHPLSALIALGIFALVFITTKIVSVSSILAVISYPIISIFGFGIRDHLFIVICLLFVGIVLLTHISNIRRLAKGKEPQLKITKKKSRSRT